MAAAERTLFQQQKQGEMKIGEQETTREDVEFVADADAEDRSDEDTLVVEATPARPRWQDAAATVWARGVACWHVARQSRGVQHLARWGRAIYHSRAVRRAAKASLVLFLLFCALVVYTWNTTPSTYDINARVHAAVAAHNDPYIPYAQIAPVMSQALIAAEDEHFYSNHGIDVVSLARALWDDLLAWKFIEGGSTLTQQLAKNVYLNDNDHNLWAKWRDMIMAVKIEQHASKHQILEWYLNFVYFGDGANGIWAASMHYFGVPPARLDLAQAAMLAGLVRAPSAYDPFCAPTLARERQQTVLAQMSADGMITAAQEQTARAETFTFWQPNTPHQTDVYCAT